MSARVINFSILVLVVVAALSGLASFLVGEPAWRWVFWAHRIAGFALVPLLFWKWRIVTASFRRRGAGLWATPSVVLTALLLGSLATGVLWSTTGMPSVPLPVFGLRVSGLTLHVILAVAMVPVLAQHLVVRWPHPARVAQTERRAFVRQAGLLAVGAIAWQATEVASRVLALSGAERRFTGSREEASFAGNAHPVTNWLTDERQRIEADAWRLRVGGAVGRSLELRYADLDSRDASLERATERAILDCTGGWYTEQRWSGVPLSALLELAAPQPGARSVIVRSATGYERRFPVEHAARLLLATRVEDAPLNASHGFPLRLVAPGYRGFHWVKWITDIEVSEQPSWLQPPLPLQ